MRRALTLLSALALAVACASPPEQRPIPGMMPTPVAAAPDTAEEAVVAETLEVVEPEPMAEEMDTLAPVEPLAAEPEEAPDTLALETLPEVSGAEPPAAIPEVAPPQDEPPPDLGPGTIGPGFTEPQVRTVLGDPLYRSVYGEHTFYFYDNGREKEVGFLDFVIFRGGRVVDAVFRHPRHHYAGNSSSPRGVTARPTPGGERLGIPPAPPSRPQPQDTLPAPPQTPS